jgi:cysteine desulfurase
MPSSPSIYFDNNATTKPFKEVISVISRGMEEKYMNPFTGYSAGKMAYDAMEKSRSKIKKMLGINRKETLIFTASATESNNMVIRGRLVVLSKCTTPHIIMSSIEHSSVFQTCLDLQRSNQCSLSIIPTDCEGRIDLQKLWKEIQTHSKNIALISLILANNETGVIQDLAAISTICKGHFLHIDATQYIGKYPVRISSMNIDSLTFGGHKFHGPRIGALYLKDLHQIKNCCCSGGMSEYGLRAGTPNVAYILGMEKALSINMTNLQRNHKNVRVLRDFLEKSLKEKIPGVKINSGSANRLYNTLSVVLPINGKSRELVRHLDKHNICVNVGSACNRNTRSRILGSIGLTKPERDSTLRLSFSYLNTKKECEIFLRALHNFLHNKKF